MTSIDARHVSPNGPDRTLKTALDCDVLTLARTTQAHARAATRRSVRPADALESLYRPLGNRDVQSVINQR